jgi:hypothetical protein
LAAALDWAAVAAVAAVGWVLAGWAGAVVAGAEALLVFCLWEARWGATPGLLAARLRTVAAATDRAPGWRAAPRWALGAVAMALGGAAFWLVPLTARRGGADWIERLTASRMEPVAHGRDHETPLRPALPYAVPKVTVVAPAPAD